MITCGVGCRIGCASGWSERQVMLVDEQVPERLRADRVIGRRRRRGQRRAGAGERDSGRTADSFMAATTFAGRPRFRTSLLFGECKDRFDRRSKEMRQLQRQDRLGSKRPVSIELIVCRDTPTSVASWACVHPRSLRSSRSRVVTATFGPRRTRSRSASPFQAGARATSGERPDPAAEREQPPDEREGERPAHPLVRAHNSGCG